MPSDTSAHVTLRTGSQVSEATLVHILCILEALQHGNAIEFFTCVAIARDPKHKPLVDGAKAELQELGLLQSDGNMHDDTRAIILASVEGEGGELHLVNAVVR